MDEKEGEKKRPLQVLFRSPCHDETGDVVKDGGADEHDADRGLRKVDIFCRTAEDDEGRAQRRRRQGGADDERLDGAFWLRKRWRQKCLSEESERSLQARERLCAERIGPTVTKANVEQRIAQRDRDRDANKSGEQAQQKILLDEIKSNSKAT